MEAPRTELPARPACLPKTWLQLAEALLERRAGTGDRKKIVLARGVGRHGRYLSASMFTIYTVEGAERVRAD